MKWNDRDIWRDRLWLIWREPSVCLLDSPGSQRKDSRSKTSRRSQPGPLSGWQARKYLDYPKFSNFYNFFFYSVIFTFATIQVGLGSKTGASIILGQWPTLWTTTDTLFIVFDKSIDNAPPRGASRHLSDILPRPTIAALLKENYPFQTTSDGRSSSRFGQLGRCTRVIFPPLHPT